jgi:hypothetical protein
MYREYKAKSTYQMVPEGLFDGLLADLKGGKR